MLALGVIDMSNVWETERKEIATWLSGYLAMIKKWVDKILDNEDHDVDKVKIITQIDEWISWLEETKIKIMKMKQTIFVTVLCHSHKWLSHIRQLAQKLLKEFRIALQQIFRRLQYPLL